LLLLLVYDVDVAAVLVVLTEQSSSDRFELLTPVQELLVDPIPVLPQSPFVRHDGGIVRDRATDGLTRVVDDDIDGTILVPDVVHEGFDPGDVT
jgi:hypothetical protein